MLFDRALHLRAVVPARGGVGEGELVAARACGVAPERARTPKRVWRTRRLAPRQASEHLRRGRSFVWNATNVSRRIRSTCIRLFADYDARVRIVYVEVPDAVLRAQNRARTKQVPEDVIDALFARWEVPEPGEAHEIVWALGA